MLELKISTSNAIKYYEAISIDKRDGKNKLIKKINKSSIKKEIKDLLILHHKDLIIGDPNTIFDLNKDIMESYIPEYNVNLPQSKLKKVVENASGRINKIKAIFNYKTVSESYFLAKLLKMNTCTYCNRQYTLTIGDTNNKTTRAEYDHWFPQKYFPLLALSFYNLIPCCKICNSSIKSDKVLSLKKYVHPYVHENDKDFSFSYDLISGINAEVKLNVEETKMKNTLKEFKILDVYRGHSKYELQELIDLRYKYSDNYLNILLNETFKTGVTKEEAYRLIFGTELNKDNFHKRPLSKFKYDILKELGVLD